MNLDNSPPPPPPRLGEASAPHLQAQSDTSTWAPGPSGDAYYENNGRSCLSIFVSHVSCALAHLTRFLYTSTFASHTAGGIKGWWITQANAEMDRFQKSSPEPSKKNWIRNQEVCCQPQMQFLVQYCRWSINMNVLSFAQTAAKPWKSASWHWQHRWTNMVLIRKDGENLFPRSYTAWKITISMSCIVVMHRMVWKIMGGFHWILY